MGQLNLYIPDGSPTLEVLRSASDELGYSMNEIALGLIELNLVEYVDILRRIKVARAEEMGRFGRMLIARDQAIVDEHIALVAHGAGAGYLLSGAWVKARNLTLSYTAIQNPAPAIEDVVIAQDVKPILAETDGHLVTQEQFMAILLAAADFSEAEANEARKAAAKKAVVAIDRFRAKFISGASERGADPKKARAFYDRIVLGEPRRA